MASSGIDRANGWLVRAALPLALPLSLLLFLQWPLREVVGSYSREANDLAQILFALYVAVAVTEASRRGAHLAADTFAHRFPAPWRARLARAASLLVLIPWATFVLYAGAATAWHSALQFERFQETLNPGYFLIRLAVILLALLVFLQAVRDVVSEQPPE